MGHKELIKSRPKCIGAERPRNQMQINQSMSLKIIFQACKDILGGLQCPTPEPGGMAWSMLSVSILCDAP